MFSLKSWNLWFDNLGEFSWSDDPEWLASPYLLVLYCYIVGRNPFDKTSTDPRDGLFYKRYSKNVLALDAKYISFYEELKRNGGMDKKSVFELIDLIFEKATNRYHTFPPKEIRELFKSIMKSHGVKSVWDPFCYCSFLATNPDLNEFLGDLPENGGTMFLKEVLELFYPDKIDFDHISPENSYDWASCYHYDCIASMPPFGMRVDTYEGIWSQEEVERNFFRNAFSTNCDLVIGLVRKSVLKQQGFSDLRSDWLWDNSIETIIELPDGIFSNTSVETCLIVLTPHKKNKSMRLIDASRTATIIKGRKKLLNLDVLLPMINNGGGDAIDVNYDNIDKDNCFLNSAYFVSLKENNLKPGESFVRFEDLVEFDKGKKLQLNIVEHPTKGTLISSDDPAFFATRSFDRKAFSNDFIDAILGPSLDYKPEYVKASTQYVGPHLFLNGGGDKVKVFLYQGTEAIVLPTTNILGFKIREDVSPEYLVYLLTTDENCVRYLSESSKSGTFMPKLNCRLILGMPMIMKPLSAQITEFEKAKQEYAAKQEKEAEAEKKRLGFRSAQSDLIHMLGTPLLVQRNLIEHIRYCSIEDSKIADWVKALIDSCDYINRIITSNASDFEKQTIILGPVSISEFIESYCKSIGNALGQCFTIEVQNSGFDSMVVELNEDRMNILLDAIFVNAYRHSFHKRKSKDNHLCVALSKVAYCGNTMLLISIKNNGDALPDGFGLSDYITRGRFSGEDGHTGLGGNHVFNIVKKHNGFLALDSTSEWPMIVDILLPIFKSNDKLLISEYDNDAI